MANEPAKEMEVCATCGALLVIGDPHQRLDEHISGKQHKGFAQIRSYLDQRRLGETELSARVEYAASSPVADKVSFDYVVLMINYEVQGVKPSSSSEQCFGLRPNGCIDVRKNCSLRPNGGCNTLWQKSTTPIRGS